MHNVQTFSLIVSCNQSNYFFNLLTFIYTGKSIEKTALFFIETKTALSDEAWRCFFFHHQNVKTQESYNADHQILWQTNRSKI